jgi:DNA (cytosine-5)-methyltransferase 1
MTENVDTTKTITHVSLCAGYGGIDLGLSRAIPSLRTVAFSEIEAFACANLVAKMEAGLLDCAPIWTDLKTFPWGAFRDRVDILSGGYPCQPFSAAGKRLGTDDPRHLWPFIADGIRAMRPRMCFFENVEGHISLGLREVVGELEEIGYKVSWGIFSAREVGAPHQRKRVFILAHRESIGLSQFTDIRTGGHQVCTTENGGFLADSNKQGLEGSIQQGISCQEEQDESAAGCRRTLADTDSAGSRQDWKSSEPRPNCIEQSSVIEGGSKSGEIQKGLFWPSRPGQPQFAWEPPRVVSSTIPNPTDNGLEIDTKRTIEPSEGDRRVSYIGGVCTCEGASMGDPKHNGSHQCGAETRGAESGGEQGWLQESEGGSASVANHLRRGLQDTSNKQRYNGTDNHAGIGTRPTESSRRQTQPPLGGNPHGTTCGMDYAELCVSGDNRTDELRLLGNGVVPATAERAFRTLLAELIP